MSNEQTGSVEQIQDIFKSWFTEEELKLMEEKFNKLKEEREGAE